MTSLDEYHLKRKFNQTPEPVGNTGKKLPIFVIHKHQASHLHYDLRLAIGDSLKSWAVPKGLPKDKEKKNLAMMVEDHPYDYGNFEGNIPEHNYGAGTVMLWDRGYYEITNGQTLPESLLQGKVSFILYGEKIKGYYSMVKIDKKNSWLIILKSKIEDIKEDWQFISSGDYFSYRNLKSTDISVKSKRTMSEITLELSVEIIDIKKLGAKSKPMPKVIRPMLAKLIDRPFEDPDWLFELKLDGYRAISVMDKEKKLLSRNNILLNKKFPAVVDEMKILPFSVVFDGELVVMNESGKPDFSLIQNYTLSGNLSYFIFDLLYCNQYDFSQVQLINRKKMAKGIITEYLDSPIRYLEHIERQGVALFDFAKEEAAEGIIAKKMNSYYLFGQRSNYWLKIKTVLNQEAIIIGYSDPKGSRKYFGSLLLAVYDNEQLTYIGHSGGGFKDIDLKLLYEKMLKIGIKNSTAFKAPRAKNIHWIKPVLVCQVKFTEWTPDGLMRHPIFLGLREDKKPNEVTREN